MNIDTLCDTLSAVSTASIAYASGTPEAALLTTSSAPILADAFKEIAHFISFKFSKREKERLEIASSVAYETSSINLKKGLSYRTDNLFRRTKDGYCQFDDAFEQTIKAIRDDCDTRKSQIYGAFLGNIPFHQELDINSIMIISNILHNLSYAELCVLYSFSKTSYNGINKISKYIKSNSNGEVFGIYAALIKLRNNGMLERIPPFGLSDQIGNLTISPFGSHICEIIQTTASDESHPFHSEYFSKIEEILLEICNS